MSETALTDSTTPNDSPLLNCCPTLGTSTKVTSPSSLCANSVIPTVATSPSILIHSCSFVYRRSPGTCSIAPLLSRPHPARRAEHRAPGRAPTHRAITPPGRPSLSQH